MRHPLLPSLLLAIAALLTAAQTAAQAAPTEPAPGRAKASDGDARQVLGATIPRLTIEPAELPFSLCFHQFQQATAPRCAAHEGALDLDFAVAPEVQLVAIDFPGQLADVRVRLFDEAHRLVPSRDRLVASGEQTSYQLLPDAPLSPGSRYFLRIDGLTGALPTAADGTTYRDARIAFVTAGEKSLQSAPSPQKQKNKSPKNKKKKSPKHRRQRL